MFLASVAALTDPRGAQEPDIRSRCSCRPPLTDLLTSGNMPTQRAKWTAPAPEAVARVLGGIALEVGGAAWRPPPPYDRLIAVLSQLDPAELDPLRGRDHRDGPGFGHEKRNTLPTSRFKAVTPETLEPLSPPTRPSWQ